MSMLADDHALEEITFTAEGILANLAPGAVHASCSTISTALSRRLAAEHTARQQLFVSSPVFGRPEAAEAKKLLVVAAGPAEAIERCKPLFDAVGRQTFIAGPEPWQANVVKLCGNFMIASMIETFGEANAALRKSSVDPHLFLSVMNELFASPGLRQLWPNHCRRGIRACRLRAASWTQGCTAGARNGIRVSVAHAGCERHPGSVACPRLRTVRPIRTGPASLVRPHATPVSEGI